MSAVPISNVEKPLWPSGFRKGDMVAYYEAIAPVLLPHLARRPVTLRRFPDGVTGVNWYQFQWPHGHPAWLRSVELRGFRVCLIEDEASLRWAANLAAVELHPLAASADHPGEPSYVVLDLDPGEPAGLAECREVALAARDLLTKLGLASFPKTSGSLGLHVYVPLAPAPDFSAVKAFARELARELAAALPDLVVDRTSRALRTGRVLVDWIQNDASRSTVAPYSLRAGPSPAVSTPLTWHEVAAAARLAFGPEAVLERVARLGDLFGPVLSLEQRLPR